MLRPVAGRFAIITECGRADKLFCYTMYYGVRIPPTSFSRRWDRNKGSAPTADLKSAKRVESPWCGVRFQISKQSMFRRILYVQDNQHTRTFTNQHCRCHDSLMTRSDWWCFSIRPVRVGFSVVYDEALIFSLQVDLRESSHL